MVTCLKMLKNKNLKIKGKHKMAPYILSDVIKVTRSPKIQNGFEKMLFTPKSALWLLS